jgi:hypothetical protein
LTHIRPENSGESVKQEMRSICQLMGRLAAIRRANLHKSESGGRLSPARRLACFQSCNREINRAGNGEKQSKEIKP